MTVGKTNTNVETGHDQSEPELEAKPETTHSGGTIVCNRNSFEI